MTTTAKKALIGHTGFVGGNLKRQHPFSHLYNSKNIDSMQGEEFEWVICAGLPGAKWIANKNPRQDWDNMTRLGEVLKTVRAGRFVLISTIDVYPVTAGVDEDFDCGSGANHPYGAHRLRFENFCRETFPDCAVARLPALFGGGLKKNVIFDLLNDHCLEAVNPESSFQYYDLDCLWGDIQKVTGHRVGIMNLFTEPVSTREVLRAFFPAKSVGSNPSPAKHYDLLTKHARLWGGKGGYVRSKKEVMDGLSRFIHRHNP